MKTQYSSKRTWVWLSVLFSFICLAGLILYLGEQNLRQVIEISHQIKLGQSAWLWALLSSGAVFLMRSLRLKLILHKLSIMESLLICATHNALTRTLPFRSGEFSLPYMLHKHHQVSFWEGSLVMLLLRLIEVASLLPFIALCVAFSPNLIKHISSDHSLVIGIVGFLSFCLVIWIRPIIQLLMQGAGLLFKTLKKDQLSYRFSKIGEITQDLSYFKCAVAMSITLFILLGQASLFYWILDGCGASLTFVEVALASILVHLAGVLPAPTIGNIGTHEMAWLVIFKNFSCHTSIALLSALLSQWLTLFFAYLWWSITKACLYFLRLKQSKS